MTKIQRVHSHAPWEKSIGYCRAIKAGNMIFVTGTAPLNADGSTCSPGNPYAQATRCINLLKYALLELGADLTHVVRTRMFVTDITLWEEYGRAHAEAFGEHPPATSMVEVKSLIAPDMMIEIEADAYIGS